MQVITIRQTGDTSVLKLENSEDLKPQKHELLIRQTAIGVNFFDICFRRGQYGLPQLPAILGMEGCGVIEALGVEVTDFKIGERVAYATGGIGGYAQKRVINQHHAISPPKELTDVQIAGSLLKGLMAHTLLFRACSLKRAKRVLIHAVTGGVGQFLCAWGASLGLEIIGTVGDDRKIPIAYALGCKHVINYTKQDFLQEVARVTNNEGVGVVYDGVGKDSLDKSIDCLWPMGICVNYGEASGNYGNFDLNSLVANSLYITRPTMALYKSNRIELTLSANEVFDKIIKGILKPQITTYNFADVAKAHQALESRSSVGSIVLTL
jgi:NADPH2:quinone reductase